MIVGPVARAVHAVISGACLATSAGADTLCEGVDVTLGAAEPELAAHLCRVTRAAVARLAACHLEVPMPLRIDVASDLGPGCLGLYHCGTSQIEILDPESFAAIVDRDGPFAAIPLPAYYDSILTHELAHAAYDDRNCLFATCPVAAEFLAYAMQIRSLSKEDRALRGGGARRSRGRAPLPHRLDADDGAAALRGRGVVLLLAERAVVRPRGGDRRRRSRPRPPAPVTRAGPHAGRT